MKLFDIIFYRYAKLLHARPTGGVRYVFAAILVGLPLCLVLFWILLLMNFKSDNHFLIYHMDELTILAGILSFGFPLLRYVFFPKHYRKRRDEIATYTSAWTTLLVMFYSGLVVLVIGLFWLFITGYRAQ